MRAYAGTGRACGAMPMAFFSSPPYELKSQCVPATLRVPVFLSSSTMHCGGARRSDVVHVPAHLVVMHVFSVRT